MSLPESIVTEVKQWSAFRLSSEADCSSPDSLTSPGAEFLDTVRVATVERLNYLSDDDLMSLPDSFTDVGAHNEIADGSVPVYTHDLWATFVDVGGYREDPSDYGDGSETNMDQLANVCLYLIAERLVGSIVESVGSMLSDAIDLGVERATDRGTAEGTAAATWVEIPDADTALWFAGGIANIDPEIMDALPSADLSGQHADHTTVADLITDADLSGIDPASDIGQQLADAYEEAFSSAVEAEVVRACNYQLTD